MTVSMLHGAGRIPAQGSRQARPLSCRRDAAGDRHAPELAADRPGAGDQGGPAGVPVCCTFQGEELFLDRLGEPYRSKSLELIREHAAQRGCVRRGEPLRRRPDGRLPRHRPRPHPRRAARHQPRRSRAAGRRRSRAVHDRLPGAHRAGEGPARAVRGVSPPASRGAALPPSRLWAPATSGRSTAATSPTSRSRWTEWGLAGTLPSTTANWTGPRSSPSCAS